MADMKQMFSEEIRRLARKEVKAAIVPLQQSLGSLRKQYFELKKAYAALEKNITSADKVSAAMKPQEETEPAKQHIRLNAAMIRSLRTKLGLTQGELAKCVGCNLVSVSHWELGKTTPRMEQKIKLAALRKTGKRAIKKILEAQQPADNKVKACKKENVPAAKPDAGKNPQD